MNGENIPLLAYFFVSVTSLVLAYVTYTDEISKIPGQIKQTVDSSTSTASSTLSSLTSGLSNPFSSTSAPASSTSSTENTQASSSLTSLNPFTSSEEKPNNMTGGKKKHKKTKRHHSKPNHNKTKHNKHNKCIRI